MCLRASGNPKEPELIRLAMPSLGLVEEEACLRVLRSGRLVQGPEGEAFEQAFALSVGSAFAIAVSSGTAALQLALMALSVGKGDEVVLPACTYIATANAVALSGAEVVLADVQSDSLNLDPESLGRVMEPQTRVIMPVHQYGLAAPVHELAKKAPHAYVIEDAACAMGAGLDGCAVGRPHGLLACFSFHPRKVMTTGEGGMVTTDDVGLAHRVRALRQHGQGDGVTLEPGSNFRMSELAAALGRAQLERLPELLARRRQVAAWYFERMADWDWLQLPLGSDSGHIFQSFVVLLKDKDVSRDAVIEDMRAGQIECQAGVAPVHLHGPYQGVRRDALPNSEKVGRRGIFLPMHVNLNEAQVERICDRLRHVAFA